MKMDKMALYLTILLAVMACAFLINMSINRNSDNRISRTTTTIPSGEDIEYIPPPEDLGGDTSESSVDDLLGGGEDISSGGEEDVPTLPDIPLS